MAQFASIPHGVLLVREDDVGHANQFRIESEILLNGQGLSRNRNSFHKIRGMNQPEFLSLLPIGTVAEALLRQVLSKAEKLSIAGILQSIGMTTGTSCGIFIGLVFRARMEYGLAVK